MPTPQIHIRGTRFGPRPVLGVWLPRASERKLNSRLVIPRECLTVPLFSTRTMRESWGSKQGSAWSRPPHACGCPGPTHSPEPTHKPSGTQPLAHADPHRPVAASFGFALSTREAVTPPSPPPSKPRWQHPRGPRRPRNNCRAANPRRGFGTGPRNPCRSDPGNKHGVSVAVLTPTTTGSSRQVRVHINSPQSSLSPVGRGGGFIGHARRFPDTGLHAGLAGGCPRKVPQTPGRTQTCNFYSVFGLPSFRKPGEKGPSGS